MKRQFDRVSRLMSIHSHRVLGSLIALALVFTSACGAAQNTSSTCGTSEKTCAPPPAKLSKVSVETIAKGLENPWGMQFLPDGRLLVTERPGRMRIVSKDGKLSEPIAGVPEVAVIGQGGMLDVLLAPDFDTTGTIYFSYGEPREADKNATSVARARLVLNDDGGHLENVKVIFRQEPAMKSKFHFGSRLAWAPDGTLFITTGDRNHLRDEAQNPSNTVGTVVRRTSRNRAALYD
jgi:glucose/arabinose dehydrogenase